jgi:hypothetical protein
MSDSSSDGRQASTKKRPKASVERKDDAGASSEGVLANLPRTRPQRSSARRDAARRTAPEAKAKPKAKPIPSTATKPRMTAAAKTKASPAPALRTGKAKAESGPAPTRRTGNAKAKLGPVPTRKAITPKQRPVTARATAKPLQDPAPRQGFETERDPISGSVQPPGGVDLFTSAAELAGELTKSGISTGGRLLKDVFARLPLN